MKTNASKALEYVFHDEGGFAIRDTEGGGAVNRGITFTVFKAWRGLKGNAAVTFDDLKNMTIAEAEDIYRAQFLNGVHFDDLPIGVDYVVLDAAVNGGVTGSIKVLQETLHQTPDGHYGVVTRWAAQHRPSTDLINALCDTRIAHYKKFTRFYKIANPDKPSAKQITWGKVWTNRIEAVRNRATEMVTHS